MSLHESGIFEKTLNMGIYGLIQDLHRLTKSGTAIPIPNFIFYLSPSKKLDFKPFLTFS